MKRLSIVMTPYGLHCKKRLMFLDDNILWGWGRGRGSFLQTLGHLWMPANSAHVVVHTSELNCSCIIAQYPRGQALDS